MVISFFPSKRKAIVFFGKRNQLTNQPSKERTKRKLHFSFLHKQTTTTNKNFFSFFLLPNTPPTHHT